MKMSDYMLTFFDLEVNPKTKHIDKIGLVTESDRRLETTKEKTMAAFIRKNRGSYYIGHNIINHDLLYFKNKDIINKLESQYLIDTLLLSALVFSNNPYHHLVKNDKLHRDSINNPVNDAINSRILFFDIVEKFYNLDENLKDIYYLLLKDIDGFKGFFNYLKYKPKQYNISNLISLVFKDKLCERSDLSLYFKDNKVELAYALSLINTTDLKSLLPAWILKTYSIVEEILTNLRNAPCNHCNYCQTNLNSVKALNVNFGYPSFRKFDGIDLQKNAVDSALKGESLIAVFPTGGGKSLTFQLPAIMSARNTRGLTVVISPLQSLMKDQVDSLADKNINSAVAISGLLDPIERKKAIEQVSDGSASILYIAPESLRSLTIERLLMSRQITRIVIDEAHCFSTWGHDFRVDYLYIADFIKKIQKQKNLKTSIPISCFTATAKVDVIEDIKKYFYDNLDLDLVEFTTASTRENLSYSVIKVETEIERYSKLRKLLLERESPTIIYCSRIKTVKELFQKLEFDQFKVAMFHGSLDKDEKVKQQDSFMDGSVDIMVATSAFGMGIDKDNVARVIHYEISDSLENYVQEAGRAGRSQDILANCYIFYNEDDLNKHFDLLNTSKLNLSEINQIWRGIKQSTRTRNEISKSVLELATDAGWDESGYSLETRVRTAVSTLEQVGYIKRKHNTHRVFADSLLSKSVIEAKKRMKKSALLDESDEKLANIVIQNLISNKYKSLASNEVGETRIDYLSDISGYSKKDVIAIINKFREAGILANDKDLYAHIKHGTTTRGPRITINLVKGIVEVFIIEFNNNNTINLNLKRFKQTLEDQGFNANIKIIKSVINYLQLVKFIEIQKLSIDDLKVKLSFEKEEFSNKLKKIIDLADDIIEVLYKLAEKDSEVSDNDLLPFSIIQIQTIINNNGGFLSDIKTDDVEDAIYFLTRINALKIEGGFLVIYSPLNIERIEENTMKQYTQKDYEQLDNFYTTKKEQIHIVGEYAKKMSEDKDAADEYVKDYFSIEYQDFLKKYFSGKRKSELALNMTPKKYKELFGTLSDEQRAIIDDSKNKRIGVFAGPGSGKTKLLVHKLASILSTEDTKHQELLMLTFSRSAAIEFKERLYKLIGQAAYFVNITTFHSFAFDITENLGNEEDLPKVITNATKAINNLEADTFKITKSVLVIDEAQDMTKNEYDLVQALIEFNDGIRVIAVGDDDQNIFEWRNSSSEYLSMIAKEGASYELTKNFRSKNNLVQFANLIAESITNRQKDKTISSYTNDNGYIETYTYNDDNLIIPLTNKVIEDNPRGRTAIITNTNEDAIMINTILNEAGLKTSLIQSYDDFRLIHLLEIRTFYDYIKSNTDFRVTDSIKANAFYELKRKHVNSANYNMARSALNKLLTNYNELFISDLNNLLFETMNSDLYDNNSIVVSTYHKAKGKEFDNVYLLYKVKSRLEVKDRLTEDEDRRNFYVGVTRARNKLSIHSKMNFGGIKYNNITHKEVSETYESPKTIDLVASHRDLNLYMSRVYKDNLEGIEAGIELTMNDKYDLIHKGKRLARLSKKAVEDLAKLQNNGFTLKKITLNYLVYWYSQEDDKEYLLSLPMFRFKKE